MSFYEELKKFMIRLTGTDVMDDIRKRTRITSPTEAKKNGPIIEKIMDHDPTALENVDKQNVFIIHAAFIFAVVSDKLELLKKYDKSLASNDTKLYMNMFAKNSTNAEMKIYVTENFKLGAFENMFCTYIGVCEIYDYIIKMANGDNRLITSYTLAKCLYYPKYVNRLYEFCCCNGHLNIIKRIEGRYDVTNDNYRGLMKAFEYNHSDIVSYLLNSHTIPEDVASQIE